MPVRGRIGDLDSIYNMGEVAAIQGDNGVFGGGLTDVALTYICCANCGCIAGTCDVGLSCIDSTVCVDSQGYEGGACLANGSCHRGNRCDATTSTCVFCSPGTPGCQCTTAGGCNSGLVCAAGACLPSSALPPANPACFTPCPQLMPAGMTCGTDGLMAGCFDGQVCTQGSCLPPGGTKATCANDLACPFFQVCLAGGCYSNCDINADCPSGLGCYNSCRTTTCAGSLAGAAGNGCWSISPRRVSPPKQ